MKNIEKGYRHIKLWMVIKEGAWCLNGMFSGIGALAVMCIVFFKFNSGVVFTFSKLEAVIKILNIKPDFYFLAFCMLFVLFMIVSLQLIYSAYTVIKILFYKKSIKQVEK